ncbi:MAG: NYN domain-containing protein [Chitinophagaceae bacterium]|nr:NYN domain-containing protein [Chitinophagaceae bacterium]
MTPKPTIISEVNQLFSKSFSNLLPFCADTTFHNCNRPYFHISNTGIPGRPKAESVWAFIDSNNLHWGAKEQGWKIDWPSFREYLQDVHSVEKAIMFMGRLKEYAWLYRQLEQSGFELIFNKTARISNNRIDGGNIDAALAASIMDHKNDYDSVILVADDSDYSNAIERLQRQSKLKIIISPHSIDKTSKQIKKIVGNEKVISISTIRSLIQK